MGWKQIYPLVSGLTQLVRSPKTSVVSVVAARLQARRRHRVRRPYGQAPTDQRYESIPGKRPLHGDCEGTCTGAGRVPDPVLLRPSLEEAIAWRRC